MISLAMVVSGVSAGSATVAAAVIIYQGQTLDIVERYGLLGLHAIVVLSMLKIGWEQVRVTRNIETVLSTIVARTSSDKADYDQERDRAVREVKEAVNDARDALMQAFVNHQNNRRSKLP